MLEERTELIVRLTPGPPAATLRLAACKLVIQVTACAIA